MIYKTVTLLFLILLLFCLSACNKNGTGHNNGNNPPDTTACETGIRTFTVSQLGKVLGKLNIDENMDTVIINNALHIDSIPMEIVRFSIPFNAGSSFVGVEANLFVFIQSINPNIDYYDFVVINPKLLVSRSKYNYDAFKDSTFYGEAFICFFDFDNNNTGKDILVLRNSYLDSGKTTTTTRDTFAIDASKHTVVIDRVPYLKDLVVSDNAFMHYTFGCQFESRPNNMFVLTKYKNLGYENAHCGFFWDDNYNPYPQEQEVEYIFAFFPVLPSIYGNRFGGIKLTRN